LSGSHASHVTNANHMQTRLRSMHACSTPPTLSLFFLASLTSPPFLGTLAGKNLQGLSFSLLMDSTSPDHLSTPPPLSHLTRRHLTRSPTLARAGHPVVIVHVAVAMATSAPSPPRTGRSRPSSTLATARNHLGDARSDNLNPPCERQRRRQVPSFRRASRGQK
jgi:hypothetical protein